MPPHGPQPHILPITQTRVQARYWLYTDKPSSAWVIGPDVVEVHDIVPALLPLKGLEPLCARHSPAKPQVHRFGVFSREEAEN